MAAPLASGISICGVSAAIRARPVVPIMVSSLVVVFTCIEMLILPFLAQYFLTSEPMVADGWMGLAVKSDSGAIATATAWNPGTCMYYQELWEAERLFDNPAADRSALSPAADARIKKKPEPARIIRRVPVRPTGRRETDYFTISTRFTSTELRSKVWESTLPCSRTVS